MRLINTNAIILNMVDKPLTYKFREDPNGPEIEKMVTLGHVIREAVLSDYANEKVSFAVAADRVDIAQRCKDSDVSVQISDKEREEIKNLIAKRWSIMITGRAVILLDAAPATVAPPAAANAA